MSGWANHIEPIKGTRRRICRMRMRRCQSRGLWNGGILEARGRLHPVVTQRPADDRKPLVERERSRGEAVFQVMDVPAFQPSAAEFVSSYRSSSGTWMPGVIDQSLLRSAVTSCYASVAVAEPSPAATVHRV